jgi:membrane protein YqaA with SNARE-associated domain
VKSLKNILGKYTLFLWALMKPLGAWGVFLAGLLDSAFIGLPVDVVVATYVYNNRLRYLLYVLMASAGSTLGSLIVYWIGLKGGAVLLRKRMSPERLRKIEAAFAQHEFLALMVPAMLPPPTPFKLFELAAAAFEMPVGKFLLAIFTGRCIRFLIVGALTIKFGPQFVHWSVAFFHHHFWWIALAVVAVAALWLLMGRKQPAAGSQAVAEPGEPQQPRL